MDIIFSSKDGKVRVDREDAPLRFRLLATDEWVYFFSPPPELGKDFAFRSEIPVWSSGRYVSKKDFALILSYLAQWTGKEPSFELRDVEFLEDLEQR